MNSAGYLTGAIGIGFAIAFGMYAGIKTATWCLGPLKVNVGPIKVTLHSDD